MGCLPWSILLLAFVALSFGKDKDQNGPIVATAFLREAAPVQRLIIGVVNFYQKDPQGPVTIIAFAYGDENWFTQHSQYGFNIHQYGDILARDASDIGEVFIGTGFLEHACPPDEGRREGNLGNFPSNNLHQINGHKTVDLVETHELPGSIIGRGISILKFEDPCENYTANFNDIAAFGTIGIGLHAPDDIGVERSHSLLTAHLTGSATCFECTGSAWLWEDDVGVIRFRASVIVYDTLDKAHGFVLHQSGDISTKDGTLMGERFASDDGEDDEDEDRTDGNLGNNQFFVQVGLDYAQIWIETEVTGFTMREAAGRSLATYQNFDHGDKCKNGALGEMLTFGVFGIPGPNARPDPIPRSVEITPPRDDDDCEIPDRPDKLTPVPVDSDDGDSAAGLLASMGVVFGVLVAQFFL